MLYNPFVSSTSQVSIKKIEDSKIFLTININDYMPTKIVFYENNKYKICEGIFVALILVLIMILKHLRNY